MSNYLTTTEVAEELRTPVETVRYWRHVGKGPEVVQARSSGALRRQRRRRLRC
jgi:hypothetical protein